MIYLIYEREFMLLPSFFYKVVHPHSLNKFSNDTDLVNPVQDGRLHFEFFVKFVSPVKSIHPIKLRHILQLAKERTYTSGLLECIIYPIIIICTCTFCSVSFQCAVALINMITSE